MCCGQKLLFGNAYRIGKCPVHEFDASIDIQHPDTNRGGIQNQLHNALLRMQITITFGQRLQHAVKCQTQLGDFIVSTELEAQV